MSTIVEIVDLNRWVIVLVSEKSREAAETCSSVIRTVLDLQPQMCSVVSTCECLISPSLLDHYPFDALPDTDLFDLPTVARSMLLHHKLLLDRNEGTNEFSTDEVLSCEPYYLLQPSSVCQLFNQSMASQPIPDPLLQEVLKYCQQPQQSQPQDHKQLRECVNKHSIFAGRNPLVSSVHGCNVACDGKLFSLLCVQEVAELKEKEIVGPGGSVAAAIELSTATDTEIPSASGDLSRTLSEFFVMSTAIVITVSQTGIGDLVDVLEVVESVSDWKRLGLTLGLLLKPTLTDIETYRRGKPDDCKIDMLSAWLEQQDNVSQKGIPSWIVLRAALKKIRRA